MIHHVPPTIIMTAAKTVQPTAQPLGSASRPLLGCVACVMSTPFLGRIRSFPLQVRRGGVRMHHPWRMSPCPEGSARFLVIAAPEALNLVSDVIAQGEGDT